MSIVNAVQGGSPDAVNGALKADPSAGGGIVYVFQDEFTDTNGVQADAHTPDLDSWSAAGWVKPVANEGVIQSNRMVTKTTSNSEIHLVPSTATNRYMNLEFVVHYTNSLSTRWVGVSSGGSSGGLGDVFCVVSDPADNLLEIRSPRSTVKASKAYTVNVATDYKVLATWSGNDVTMNVDGTDELTWTAPAASQNQIVIWWNAGYADYNTVDYLYAWEVS